MWEQLLASCVIAASLYRSPEEFIFFPAILAFSRMGFADISDNRNYQTWIWKALSLARHIRDVQVFLLNKNHEQE